MGIQLVRFAAVTAFATLFIVARCFAQEPVSLQIDSNRGVEPGTEVTIDDALAQSASGATIPLTGYTFTGSRGTYKGVIVGGDPFNNPKPVTINAVWIPLVISVIDQNGKIVTFDPTAPDSCDPDGQSPANRFLFSPLVTPTNLTGVTFNGASIGTAQYIDGFMKAEFWNRTGGSSSYSNFINWVLGSPVYFPPVPGKVTGTGCSEQGIITEALFESTMLGIIPALQTSGVISPSKFAFFLLANVVTSKTSGNIIGGKHYHTGSPVQTWARAPYKVTFDVEIASHEIGEWMNDPLGTNLTPPWGAEGEIKSGSCSSKFEVGDPLNGKTVLLKNAFGTYTYHVQELAFFSWFYDAEGATSVGAGGKFSSNGTFSGPSKNCPPGGTH